NVVSDPTAYVGTSYSFVRFRSEEPVGLRIGRAATLGDLTILDVGPRGRVVIGDYALVNGALILCDSEVTIGDYALIGWDVVLMDTYRVPFDVARRRRALERLTRESPGRLAAAAPRRPLVVRRLGHPSSTACGFTDSSPATALCRAARRVGPVCLGLRAACFWLQAEPGPAPSGEARQIPCGFAAHSSAFSPWSPSRRAVQPATASRAASGAYSARRTPTSPVAARPSRAAWRRPPAAPPPSPARRPPPMTRAWRPSPGAARPASSPPAAPGRGSRTSGHAAPSRGRAASACPR